MPTNWMNETAHRLHPTLPKDWQWYAPCQKCGATGKAKK